MLGMTNSIMIDLDDPRTEKIADVISNKTAKRILGMLADRELSESELAKELGIPLNTTEYNIRKLEEAGLIEKVKGFLWSVKGKRIHRYRVSNRKIVISPRRIIGGVIPSILISGAIALGIKIWVESKIAVSKMAQTAVDVGTKSEEMVGGGGAIVSEAAEKSIGVVSERAGEAVGGGAQFIDSGSGVLAIAQNAWLWFLAGALFGLLIFLVWNYLFRRRE